MKHISHLSQLIVTGIFFVLLAPLSASAQCATWNTSIDPATGTPFNTIEQPPGTVIGVADTTTGLAQTFDGIPLSQSGVDCVTKDNEVYDPDDLDTPLPPNEQEEEEEEEGGNGGLPAICQIVPTLALCQNPNGGGGNNGGGNNGGGNGNGQEEQQPEKIDTNPAEEGGGSSEGGDEAAAVMGYSGDRNLSKDGKRNNPVTSLGTSLSHDLMGDRSGILLDRRTLEENTPDLISVDSAGEDGGERPNLGKFFKYENHTKVPDSQTLSVDDEVLKTAMAVYTPMRRLRADFQNSEIARDDYLDGALTLRGVTLMAMGFLDKTLGAGLHALDQQSTGNINNQLIKQLTWTTTRLSNDDRAHVMRDVDEKVEACLEKALHDGAAPKQIQASDTTRPWVWTEQCSPECGKKPTADTRFRGTSGGAQGTKLNEMGNGTYAYCVCCAETAKNLNQLGEGDRAPVNLENADPDELWSLVERAFYGVAPEKDDTLMKRVETFKLLYGDIVLKRAKAKNGEEGFYHYSTQMPKASPKKIVSMYKNSCHHEAGDLIDLSIPGKCNLDEINKFKVECGICPALMNILDQWDNILKGQYTPKNCGRDLAGAWMEASAGHPLNGREIKQFLALNGDPQSNLESGKENELAARVIESWCEASATAAAARLYSVTRASAADHVVLSNTINGRDKAQFLALAERYQEHLALAQLDANSKLQATAILTGASILYDRAVAANTMSAQVKANAATQSAAQTALFNGWGANSYGTIAGGGE